MSDVRTCPCGSGEAFDRCCAPVLADVRAAPTAERLMRSRYTAFSLGDRAHLLASWHPTTRPDDLELDDLEWLGLTIVDVVPGGPWDDEGVVEFVARYRGASRGRIHERSRFVRERGRWLYVDGS